MEVPPTHTASEAGERMHKGWLFALIIVALFYHPNPAHAGGKASRHTRHQATQVEPLDCTDKQSVFSWIWMTPDGKALPKESTFVVSDTSGHAQAVQPQDIAGITEYIFDEAIPNNKTLSLQRKFGILTKKKGQRAELLQVLTMTMLLVSPRNECSSPDAPMLISTDPEGYFKVIVDGLHGTVTMGAKETFAVRMNMALSSDTNAEAEFETE